MRAPPTRPKVSELAKLSSRYIKSSSRTNLRPRSVAKRSGEGERSDRPHRVCVHEMMDTESSGGRRGVVIERTSRPLLLDRGSTV